MNVVGKVGSLITQGVYSVATPFHPFGGAVDVIVVQQQDGSFRSTPWYVRFGKFQGVLKGAEKVVRISVNGVEANFHMYLDNSGEAYFISEVEPGKGNDGSGIIGDSELGGIIGLEGARSNVCRLEHSVSDSGVAQLRNEYVASGAGKLERAESDADRRFYEFQDDQSLDDSEYGSSRFENLDSEHLEEHHQGLNSEVVLVSVDGHILTAPISASEQNTEDVELDTPQFHLGPGEGSEFIEGSGELISGDNTWNADYICKLDASPKPDDVPANVCSVNNGDVALVYQPEVCNGNGEQSSKTETVKDNSNKEEDVHVEGESLSITKREDVFKSCLELPELAKDIADPKKKQLDSTLVTEESEDKSSHGDLGGPDVDETENQEIVESGSDDGLPESPPSGKHVSPKLQVEVPEMDENELSFNRESTPITAIVNDLERKDNLFESPAVTEGIDNSLQNIAAQDDDCRTSEDVESQIVTCSQGIQTNSSMGFEISLCCNELHPGMGLAAAAEIFEAHRISAEEYSNSATSILKNENLIIRYGEKYFTWEKASPFVLGMAAFGLDIHLELKDAIPVGLDDTTKPTDDDSGTPTTPSGRRWRLWPIAFRSRKVRTLEHTDSNSSSEEVFVDTESSISNSQLESTPKSEGGSLTPHPKQFIRTNVPTSEQIASLNLKDGQNMITFSFSTRVLGTQEVDAHIYLWKWNARIVISDVDGTITKSDVLGQFMPLVGRDWSQSGVARLFSAIKENGYQLLFLSARAIVQAYLTRSFLLNLKQDGNAMPNGPVVISPDGLFPSLYREVIRRAPHEFKIACLEDIKKLFPSDYNPFYAGFGNRDTDELSYRKMGIPKGKIFIINPKGEVANCHRIDVKSYTSLHTLVNDMFPPTSMVEQEDFNSWNFWRTPLPEIE
ncbi:hypothetical protein ACFE04_001989 [Oxalis oulophora]